MIPASPYDIVKIMDRRALEAERREQVRRLVQEAELGAGQWVPALVGRLVRESGRVLMIVGRRLQKIAAAEGLDPHPTSTARDCGRSLSRSRR